ncbi:MerR family transcriptional regulator [Nocardioides nanhaiensis]|uniref:MerR family transcriptional regulator n=1 Tax=Nocardioides nanhaiensis TaxID=1476871 RepID=UPI0031EFF4F4
MATTLGVPVHALHHWDALGVVVPDRTGAGHRTYTDEHLVRLRILLSCREVGMSLAEIRLVLHRDEAGRAAVLRQRLDHVREQRRRLDRAQAFLEHVVGCRHDLVSRCPDCAAYASA